MGTPISLAMKAGKAAKAVSKADDVVKPTQRGLQNEAKVLTSEGLTKNTKKVSSKEGNSIPDAQTKNKIVDVKDTKRVSDTRQIRIQRQAAIDSKRKHIIITGAKTKVSKNVEQPPTKVKRRDDMGPQ